MTYADLRQKEAQRGGVDVQTPPKPLEVTTLAEQIGALHRDIEAQPARYVEIHTLLTQAKKQAGDGGWLKWLADNEQTLGFGERQARLYMRSPELRSSDLKARAGDQKKRRAAAKKSKPKLTPAEHLAIKNETAVLNPITGKVVKLTPAELLAIEQKPAQAFDPNRERCVQRVLHPGLELLQLPSDRRLSLGGLLLAGQGALQYLASRDLARGHVGGLLGGVLANRADLDLMDAAANTSPVDLAEEVVPAGGRGREGRLAAVRHAALVVDGYHLARAGVDRGGLILVVPTGQRSGKGHADA
jgi:hypothetical protein